MTRATCPLCSKPFTFERLADHPGFPFCSERCKLIDFGRWIDGAYPIAGAPRGSPGVEDGDEELPDTDDDEDQDD